jgi:hypothetical protein
VSSPAPTRSIDGRLLGRLLVAGEGCGPKRSRVGLEAGEPFWIDLVHAPGAGGVVCYQTGGFEHLEVLGHGGPSDREPASDLYYRLGPGTQPFQDGPASPITERIEQNVMICHWCVLTNRAWRITVSHH